ncbi:ESX-1 ATPase, AAA family, EccA1 [Mycobacteroides abscessus subsp. abscessus]|uniref:hypothetical protein n=1 Tax=Mycobacteroides abscessus TaxID=36809 RepID=UPI0009261BE7|nr:hypothetical protein [Mycobacteroides abscessus]SHY07479.1 ESX-1 ATPase, AAA family, EccA1 [Mycobacteroides abscessus subsp. abscessus]SIC74942.1 ESX-1 ATPase, AAA family, EccA1 [Mycobacteroides abscessus subsp. abscessus]SKP28708.1 ESX-1 ATPase, AAA family, EccA1 [Mycobacteroides abscessus subsp. abscessus]
MILMQIWNSYEILGVPDKTLWFSSPEHQLTYLKHFTINADDAPVRHLITPLPQAFQIGAVPAGIDLDPEPPTIGHLYTATWDGMTATTTHDVQLIPISHLADHQPAEEPQYLSSAPRFRLTEIKWGRKVEGQYSKVTLAGLDQDAVTAAFDALIEDLNNRNRLTDKNTLKSIKASEDDEYNTFYAPVIDGERTMSASFFGIDRLIAGDVFATRARLRREYIAAQAQARKDAGVSDSAYPDQVPDVFYTHEERWAEEAERMRKAWSVNAAAIAEQAASIGDWPIPPVMPDAASKTTTTVNSPPPFSGQNAAIQKPNLARPMFPSPMSMFSAPQGPPFGASLLSPPTQSLMSTGPLNPGSTISENFAAEVAQAAAAAADKYLTASPVSIAGQIAHQLRAQADIYEQEAVRAERREGASWTDIGDGLGMKKQGAHKRFRDLDSEWEEFQHALKQETSIFASPADALSRAQSALDAMNFPVTTKQQYLELAARAEAGRGCWNLVFLGSGGRKDAMARIVADMYYGHGIVPEAKFTHISCAELIAAAAQEADSLAATFLSSAAKNANGGVLYLHDAQALSLRDWPRLTDQLVIEMENRRDSLAVILSADSSEAINRLRAVSPGLDARVLGISFPA